MTTSPPTATPTSQPPAKRTLRDYQSDQEPRWCPGCGDYSILKQVQTVLAEENVPPEQVVFISGIGCSSRFPYYMRTYGIHGIHGRAPAIAFGLSVVRPDLSIWIITGDGDGLAIGGNHLFHILRRNPNVQILLFNNEIYGLTKGQYSPTSPLGKVTKSSPWGSPDEPVNPIAFALGSHASFVARTLDRHPTHLKETLRAAMHHRGAAFVEIYQNCNIFNDGAFELYTDKKTQPVHALFLKEGEPMTFGPNNQYVLHWTGTTNQQQEEPFIVFRQDDTPDTLTPFTTRNRHLAWALAWRLHPVSVPVYRRDGTPTEESITLPRPFGIFFQEERPTYQEHLAHQLEKAREHIQPIAQLIQGELTWTVS